jgi:hypothetical protein
MFRFADNHMGNSSSSSGGSDSGYVYTKSEDSVGWSNNKKVDGNWESYNGGNTWQARDTSNEY